MINEKKMAQHLRGITMFFFIQPLLALINSNSYNNIISLAILITIGVISIAAGFGLKHRKEWARIMGMILCTLEGIFSIALLVWFPYYFKKTIAGNDFLWFILLTDGIILLYIVAYFAMAWRLNTREMKEYLVTQQMKKNT